MLQIIKYVILAYQKDREKYVLKNIFFFRFLIVCHPFYTVSHQWSAMRYMIPILTWSLLYNFPKFFELHTAFDEKAVDEPG